MKRVSRGVVAVVAGLVVAGSASAEPCAGPSSFADVPVSSIFCTNAQWLANRGITQGCGGGNFCPSDAVSRAQMALFLNRLGTALGPLVYTATESIVSPSNFASTVYMCQTQDIATGAVPRRLTASSTVNLFGVAGAGLGIAAKLMYSFNGGTTWIPFGAGAQWGTYGTLYPGQTPSAEITMTQIAPDALVPSAATVRVAVSVVRANGTGTTSAWCALRVSVAQAPAEPMLADPASDDGWPPAK